jgi:hypothetical protein
MKACQNCDRINSDEVEICYHCGTKFRVWEPPEPLTSQDQDKPKSETGLDDKPVSFRRRCFLWLTAWGFVALAVCAINPEYLRAIFFFPIGLFGLFGGDEKAVETSFTACATGAFIFGWLLYAALSVAIFTVGKRKTFTAIYIIFCILLALNVGGCQRVLESMSHIQ